MTMNDKMKTVREALEEAIAIDRRDNGGDPSMYTTQLEAAIAALDSMEAEAGEVVGLTEHFTYIFDDEEIVAMSEAAAGYRWMGDTKQFDLCAKAMKKVLMQWRDSFHPKAQGEVELTEEDLAEIAHQQRRKGLDELSLTLSGAKLMEDGAMNALRHLTSKYRLIPR